VDSTWKTVDTTVWRFRIRDSVLVGKPDSTNTTVDTVAEYIVREWVEDSGFVSITRSEFTGYVNSIDRSPFIGHCFPAGQVVSDTVVREVFAFPLYDGSADTVVLQRNVGLLNRWAWYGYRFYFDWFEMWLLEWGRRN